MPSLVSLLEYLYGFITNMSDTVIMGIVADDVRALNSIYSSSNVLEECYNILAPISLSLCLAYLITGWTQESLNPKTTKETYIKLFIRFICACFFIMYGYEIMSFFHKFFDSMTLEIIDKMAIVGPGNIDNASSFLGGLIELIVSTALIVPQAIVTIIYIIIIKVVLVRRSIDIGLHIVLSSFTMPSFILDSKRSNFIMYLKKFAALCLQGGVIVVIVIVSNMLMKGSILVPSLQGIQDVYIFNVLAPLKIVIVILTMLSLLFKSRKISMDLVGSQEY